MSDSEYFGILHNTNDHDARRQIVVLGQFHDHPSHGIQIPTNGYQEFIGPTNSVHWYRNDNDIGKFYQIAENSPVRFRCDDNYDNPDQSKDRRRVHFMSVSAFGAIVIAESDCAGWQNGEVSFAEHLPPCTYFIRSAKRDSLIGPWRVTTDHNGTKLTPKKPPTVYRYDINELRRSYAIQTFDHPILSNVSVIGVSELPIDGEPIDVSTTIQLANWFKKKLDELLSPSTIAELDKAHPGWKTALAKAVKNATPDEQQRWKRVEANLESVLADAEIFKTLQQSDAYRESRARAVQDAIDTEAEQIRTDAEAKAARALSSIAAQIKALESDRDELAEQARLEESRLAEPTARLNAIRESLRLDLDRIRNDVTVVTSLLTGDTTPTRENEAEGTATTGFRLPNTGVSLMRPVHPREFIAKRLRPCFAKAWIGVTEPTAQEIMATILGSRGIVIPNFRWFSAISESFNASQAVIACDPRWLSWKDAWQELGCFWSDDGDANQWRFLLVQNFNVALPEIWGLPLLNLLSGSCENLPDGQMWPDRLRLFLSPAPASIGLPPEQELLSHFASIGLKARFTRSLQDSTLIFDGFKADGVRPPSAMPDIEALRIEYTLGVRSEAATRFSESRKINASFDSVRSGAISDVAAIAQSLRMFDLEETEAIEMAMHARCNWISEAGTEARP